MEGGWKMMKRMEINGGGWRWMKRMEIDEEYEN